MMVQVVLYSRKNCSLCDKAIADLQQLQGEIPHELHVVDIDVDAELRTAYAERVPVLEIGPYTLEAPFDTRKLKMTLGAARDGAKQDVLYPRRVTKARPEMRAELTATDRFTLWLSRHYLALLNLAIFVYVGLPFLAPLLLQAGYPGLAKPIYTVYGAVCHQLAFRSWFINGEQPFYPREAAGVEGYLTYEQAISKEGGGTPDVVGAINQLPDARYFTGEGYENIGYKVALCQRDVAIYGAMLLFGLLFAITGRRIPPLPWFLWLSIGLGPIAMDGGSQLLSQFPLPIDLIPFRESTPFLRTLSGSLFGFMTAWFGFPLVEETMADARKIVLSKLGRIAQQGKIEK